MSNVKLVSTLKFKNSNGARAKYEIYYDKGSSEYHADIFTIASVECKDFNRPTVEVWHKHLTSFESIPGQTLQDIEVACQDHFLRK